MVGLPLIGRSLWKKQEPATAVLLVDFDELYNIVRILRCGTLFGKEETGSREESKMTTVALFSGGVLVLIFALGFLSSYLGKREVKKGVVTASKNTSSETRGGGGNLRAGPSTSNRAASFSASLGGETALSGLAANPGRLQAASSSGAGK